MQNALEIISKYAHEGAELREKFFKMSASLVDEAAFNTALCLARGGKVLLCGNGGSAADCQHVAGEFVNRFLMDRPALPALALTTDTSTITSIGNDSDFASIFSRQVEAFGGPGDVLFGISTSGNSDNVINAMFKAREKGMSVIGLTGDGGGKAATFCDILIAVPSSHTPLVQEIHLAVEHLYCQLTDYYLFENPSRLAECMQKNKKED